MMKSLQRFLISFIAKYLPSKGKRAIYILMCYLIWARSKDELTIRNELHDINRRLQLINNEDALNFVIQIKDFLMDIDDFKHLREIEGNTPNPNEILKHTPKYIKYDSEEAIFSDLQCVFGVSERYA